MEVEMKKWPMLFAAVLFASGSFVAKAENALQSFSKLSSIGDDASENGSGNSSGNGASGENGPPDNALARGDHDDERAFLVFGNMIGVDGAFLGADIRGVIGDATARNVGMARGMLSAGGKLLIIVRGLVPAAGGTNDVTSVRGAISCLSETTGTTTGGTAGTTTGSTMSVNVMTDPFPLSADGNAQINGSVQLPAECLAPIVLVTNADGGKWLAVEGTEHTSTTTTP
jgi:hypothetical protein